MYVCECGGCFWTSSLSKSPYVLLSAPETLGLPSEHRNKAVCSFPRRAVNKCLSQTPKPMGGWRKLGFQHVHNYSMNNAARHAVCTYFIYVFCAVKSSLLPDLWL